MQNACDLTFAYCFEKNWRGEAQTNQSPHTYWKQFPRDRPDLPRNPRPTQLPQLLYKGNKKETGKRQRATVRSAHTADAFRKCEANVSEETEGHWWVSQSNRRAPIPRHAWLGMELVMGHCQSQSSLFALTPSPGQADPPHPKTKPNRQTPSKSSPPDLPHLSSQQIWIPTSAQRQRDRAERVQREREIELKRVSKSWLSGGSDVNTPQ